MGTVRLTSCDQVTETDMARTATARSSNKKRRTAPRSPREQVHAALATLLNGREPGEQLLPEPRLAHQLGVSRATLREAMRSFEERGLIVRRHGVGTFVAPPPPVIETGLEELESLDTLARRIGLETRMGEAEIVEREATPHEAFRLQVPPRTIVLSEARVMMTGSMPVAFLVDVVPMAYLRQQDLGPAFNGSVLDLFIRREHPPLSHSRTDILAEAADEATARKLHLQPGDVLLKLEAQLYARDGRVVDYSIRQFVPGHFHFHVVRRVGESNIKPTEPA
jgi:GntR family transcriptional regulator